MLSLRLTVNKDSDIEFVSQPAYKKTTKRNISGEGVSPYSQGEKRCRQSDQSDKWSQAHPNLAEHTTESTSGPIHQNQLSENIELSQDDRSSEEQRLLKSALVALNRAVEGMKKASARRLMAKQMSVKAMERFKDLGLSMSQMVENTCPGVQSTLPTSFHISANPSKLNRSDFDALNKPYLSLGWAGVKRTHDLLKKPEHKGSFLAGVTAWSMNIFRDRCFNVVGILEDVGTLVAIKQIR